MHVSNRLLVLAQWPSCAITLWGSPCTYLYVFLSQKSPAERTSTCFLNGKKCTERLCGVHTEMKRRTQGACTAFASFCAAVMNMCHQCGTANSKDTYPHLSQVHRSATSKRKNSRAKYQIESDICLALANALVWMKQKIWLENIMEDSKHRFWTSASCSPKHRRLL